MTTKEFTIDEIRQSASERMNELRVGETQTIGAASPGDAVRQGDVYLICLADDRSFSSTDEIKDRQLAPGTTQGSRHVLAGDVTIWKTNPLQNDANGGTLPNELKGPSFRCNDEVTVTHPEHGDRVLPKDSVWAVVYQRAHADTVRRVQD